jgi:enoyl-CoA hydratase/carnithine racemase
MNRLTYIGCRGLDLDEREKNNSSSTHGFYPLVATILDFPFPTICLITGHVFGGACLPSLARKSHPREEDL